MGRSKEQTYKIMSGVHSENTNIEVKLRKALWEKGYRYRKNVKELPGKPDIVLTKYRINNYIPFYKFKKNITNTNCV